MKTPCLNRYVREIEDRSIVISPLESGIFEGYIRHAGGASFTVTAETPQLAIEYLDDVIARWAYGDGRLANE